MKAEAFDQVLERRLELIRTVLAAKASEYADGADRMHNFKRAAGMTGEHVLEVCVGFMVKHLVSVLDLVKKRAGGVPVPIEVTDEKIGDSINYLILLEGLFAEGRS